MSAPSLLEQIQGALERTYGMARLVDDVGRFVIGDEGYHHFYRRRTEATSAGSRRAGGGKTLVRETDEGVRVCVYYPGWLIRCLEEHPPQRGLREDNVDAFATLVEELDHLLCIADRAAAGREITMFELELHANVSKHLVLARFLAGSSPHLGPRRRAWLRYQLFFKGTFSEPEPDVGARYRDAARWALRFLERLETLGAADRLRSLRAFHRESASGKVAMIQRMAA